MKTQEFLKNFKIFFLLFAILLILNVTIVTSYSFENVDSILCKKPVLHYLFADPAKLSNLKYDLNLTEEQIKDFELIVKDEAEKIYYLDRKTKDIMGYNKIVKEITEDSKNRVKQILGDQKYIQFIEWIEGEWGLSRNLAESHARQIRIKDNYICCGVYATQYWGNTDYEIALPDKYLKFANRGWSPLISGYSYGSNYSVSLERDGYTVDNILIWDVGPWNEDDNYWNPSPPTTHPRPRRIFTDLPQGMPEAQAAYFDDYNDGKDSFGRIVTNPAGIDLTPDVAADLGLAYLQNDWVTVTYLWEDSSPKFNIGDYVEVYNTGVSGLNVRSTPCGDPPIGKKYDGDIGQILDGPICCDNYNRWLIHWSEDGLEGWSAEDWLKKSSSPYIVPPTVTTLPADNINTTSARLHGSINDTGGEDPFDAGFGYRLKSGGPETVVKYGVGNYYADLTGLAPGTTYEFRFWAENSAGRTYGSYLSFTTLPSIVPPTGIQASDGTYTDKVRITWNSVSGASYYRVYRATSSGGSKTALGSWQSSTLYDDTSANPGTTYYYFVKAATSSSGSNASDYSTYDPGWRKLSPPTGVSATDGTYTDKVRILWNSVSGASYYHVYRATSSGGSKTPIGSWQSSTSYDDTSATPGKTYYYFVKAAINSSGYRESDYSSYNQGSCSVTRIISLSGNLSFGDVQVGTTSTKTLTISNDGNSTLTVSSISYPIGFSGNWSGPISAGGSHDVTVTFSPTQVKYYSGNLTVNSDKTSGTNTKSISGTGVPEPTRIIRLVGDLNFRDVQVGQSSQRILTIYNDGNSTLTVSSISYPIGFSGNWSGPISAGGSHNVTVTFSPTQPITYSGNLTVNSDKTGGTDTKSVSGNGTTEPTRIIRLVGDLIFGDVQVGQSSQKTLTIYNDGNSTLAVSSINYPAGFSGDWSGAISAGGHHDVIVTFSPTQVKYYSGTLIVNSDKTGGTNTKSVSGTGVPSTYPPQVTTNDASNITYTLAQLNGNLDSTGNLNCQVWFEYGKTIAYGSSTTKQSKSSVGPFNETISSLDPNTTYHFRACASNTEGTDYGVDKAFTTKANFPGTAPFSNVTTNSIQANWTANGNPSGTQYYCENTTKGTNSGWVTNVYWNSTGLSVNTNYHFQVKAKNKDGVETNWTDLGSQKTDTSTSANLELTPPTQSVTVGNQATINVVVEDIANLRGANIILNFDASKLQYVSSANGGFIPSATLLEQSVDNTNGSVTLDIAGLGASAYASGTGTIITVLFERIATGNTNVTFGTTTLRDRDNITITHTKGSGCLVTSLLGDFGSANNGLPDCKVDFEDLMIFAIAYGSTPSDDNWNPVCDIASLGGVLEPDGKIDFEDLMIFAMNYGKTCADL